MKKLDEYLAELYRLDTFASNLYMRPSIYSRDGYKVDVFQLECEGRVVATFKDEGCQNNADFYIAARNALPVLIKMVEQARYCETGIGGYMLGDDFQTILDESENTDNETE